jgi:hypothetical protein
MLGKYTIGMTSSFTLHSNIESSIFGVNFIKPSIGSYTVDVLDLGVIRTVEACIYDSDRPITMWLLLKKSQIVPLSFLYFNN